MIKKNLNLPPCSQTTSLHVSCSSTYGLNLAVSYNGLCERSELLQGRYSAWSKPSALLSMSLSFEHVIPLCWWCRDGLWVLLVYVRAYAPPFHNHPSHTTIYTKVDNRTSRIAVDKLNTACILSSFRF